MHSCLKTEPLKNSSWHCWALKNLVFSVLTLHPTLCLANKIELQCARLIFFTCLGGGGQVHLKKIALRGWATGKYEYKGIGHTKVSGVYTKLHQTPPPPQWKNKQSLIYIYHIRDGYTRGCAPPSPGQGGAIFHDKAKKTKWDTVIWVITWW
jgi:hypothetical protein